MKICNWEGWSISWHSEDRQKAPDRAIISEEAVDTVQEMARQLVRDTRARRLVPELQDQVLKVARCLYIEEFQREASQTAIQR